MRLPDDLSGFGSHVFVVHGGVVGVKYRIKIINMVMHELIREESLVLVGLVGKVK